MLAALGLSQLDFIRQADRYGRVLAEASPGRKLALLIGIEYHQDKTVPSLPGCITDLELQWHLLVHRYGFNPKDILVLSDRQPNFLNQQPLAPTRQAILDAFEHHLIQQAKAGDTVVFHYSGHGALVADDRSKPPCSRKQAMPSMAQSCRSIICLTLTPPTFEILWGDRCFCSLTHSKPTM